MRDKTGSACKADVGTQSTAGRMQRCTTSSGCCVNGLGQVEGGCIWHERNALTEVIQDDNYGKVV